MSPSGRHAKTGVAAPCGRKMLRILEGMNGFLPKLVVLGVVAGGFYATGDIARLIERGRGIAERSSVPLPGADSPAVAANPAPAGRDVTHPTLPPKFEAPPPAAAQPSPRAPTVPEPTASPPTDRAAEEPTRIPMPPLALEAIDLVSLQPGQRVLLLCGRLVVALDVVDGPAGEVLEHAHACHADRTVTIASTAAPRRLVVIGCSAGSARLKPREDRRITRGTWLHLISSGAIPSGGGTPASETIGPIEGIGLE